MLLGEVKTLLPNTRSQLRKTTNITLQSLDHFIATPSDDLARKCDDLAWMLLTEIQIFVDELPLQ